MPISIGELSRLTGVGATTIRFYEDAGLLHPQGRTESGRRRYDEEAVPRLLAIRGARALGFGIAELRMFWETGTPPEALTDAVERRAGSLALLREALACDDLSLRASRLEHALASAAPLISDLPE